MSQFTSISIFRVDIYVDEFKLVEHSFELFILFLFVVGSINVYYKKLLIIS